MSLGLPNANKALPCVNGMRNVIKIDGSLLEGGGQSNIAMYNSFNFSFEEYGCICLYYRDIRTYSEYSFEKGNSRD
jgi:hypothetical protein